MEHPEKLDIGADPDAGDRSSSVRAAGSLRSLRVGFPGPLEVVVPAAKINHRASFFTCHAYR